MEDEALPVELHAQPFDLHFHPHANVFTTGLIDGTVEMYKYESDRVERLWTLKAHKESCRAVRYAEGGRYVLSGSPDMSILAIDAVTGKSVARLKKSHSAPINRLVNLTENTVASGDDAGTIKVWDTRQNECVSTFKAHTEFVTDMEFVPSTMQLLSVSGDGTLAVSSLKKGKVETQSEHAEDELLSVVLLKHGRKVVCGSTDGVLLLYSFGHFEDCSDRFPGHPNSVDALLKVDESTLVSGSSDGLIRLVSILPNKMEGVVGEHNENPIERLAFSHDQHILASASHDNFIKLWDVAYLYEEDGGEDEAEGMDEDEPSTPALPAADVKGKSVATADSGDDDDEDSDDPGSRSRTKKDKKKKGKKKAGKSSFFDDL